MATRKFRKRRKKPGGVPAAMTVTLQPGEVPSDAELEAEAQAIGDDTHGRYELAKKDDFSLAALQRMSTNEIAKIAKSENIDDFTSLPKQKLVFEVLRARARKQGLMMGEGTLAMMRNLEIERLTLAAMSVGIARRCVSVMLDYAGQRKTFGVPIREHGQVQRYIAESYAEYRAAASLVFDLARRFDLSRTGPRLEADAAKLFASQVAKRAADAAIQVLGGYGYMGEYVVQRLWRDAKLLEIGGGTLEAHQKNLVKDLSQDPTRVRA